MALDTLEFRTPLVDFPARSGPIGLIVTPSWQRRLKSLWEFVQQPRRILSFSAAHTIVRSDADAILVCTAALTMTLPTSSAIGDTYYIFNNSTGTIVIAGNINGVAAGYELVNRYQYVEVTALTASTWIVTLNN